MLWTQFLCVVNFSLFNSSPFIVSAQYRVCFKSEGEFFLLYVNLCDSLGNAIFQAKSYLRNSLYWLSVKDEMTRKPNGTFEKKFLYCNFFCHDLSRSKNQKCSYNQKMFVYMPVPSLQLECFNTGWLESCNAILPEWFVLVGETLIGTVRSWLTSSHFFLFFSCPSSFRIRRNFSVRLWYKLLMESIVVVLLNHRTCMSCSWLVCQVNGGKNEKW